MFIEDTDFIDIQIYYKKSNKKYTVLTQKSFKELILDEGEKQKYTVLNLKMREMSWGLYNELQDSAVFFEDDNRRFNYKIYKENKLKKTIYSWDAKDKDKKDVPVNDKNILHLAPGIAEIIIEAYDEVTLIGDDEEKK